MRNDGAAVTRTWECRLPADVIRRSPMERRFVLFSGTSPERPTELRRIPCPHRQRKEQGKRSSSLKIYSEIHVHGEAPESDDSSRDFEANVIAQPTVCILALILSSQSIRYRCQTMIFYAENCRKFRRGEKWA